MRRRIWAGVCACAAAALAAIAADPARVTSDEQMGASPRAPGVRWTTEREWIVADIATAIRTIGARAGAPSAAPASVHQGASPASALAAFTVTADDDTSRTVHVVDHIWAPANYAQYAAAIVGSSSGCAYQSSGLTGRLLNPRAEVLQGENLRVSAVLEGDPRCAHAHVEAALLIGSLALREAAGPFTDTRRLLSRMTAHLAIADTGVQGEPTVERHLAEAVLLTLVGRQRSALEKVAQFEGRDGSAEVLAWGRVLRLRNTADWRVAGDISRLTLAEQLAALRATAYRIGDHAARRVLDSIPDADAPDWTRLLLEGSPSVGTGNRFSGEAIGRELLEGLAVRGTYAPIGSDAAAVPHLIQALSMEPSDPPVTEGRLWVIDWAMWAASIERHLLATILAHETHLYSSLGLPDDSRAFSDEVIARYSTLKLFPLAASILANDPDRRAAAMRTAVPLIRTHPELVTDWLWKCLLQKERGTPLPEPVPASVEWFSPYFLPGTVYDVAHRPYAAGSLPRFAPAQIAPLRELAPYSRELVYEMLRPLPADASVEQRAEVMGGMDAYDLALARDLAYAAWDDMEAYLARMRPVTRMTPAGWREIGDFLADRGLDDQAREAYEHWVSESDDPVSVAGTVYWLVRDYHRRGRHRDATRLADSAAEVYSYNGLLTRADLHEWRGELAQAERRLRQAAERYDTSRDLLAFLLRHGRSGDEVRDLVTKIFPAGMTRPDPSALEAPPTAGLVLQYAGRAGEREGLRKGDIIVLVDGIRVRDFEQYRVARGASTAPVMRLHVWRQDRYVALAARLRDDWPVSRLETYTAPPAR